MKVIIIPYADMAKCAWARKYFPEHSIAALPIAGKRLIEYQLDECCHKKATDVLILDWGYDARLAQELGNGSRWGLNLTYIGASSGITLQSQIRRHSRFMGDLNTEFILENSVGGHPIDSLENYFKANFAVLKDPGGLSLPGYSAEAGVFAGMNVIIKQDVSVEAPVMLGDNARLERGVSISGGAVIGHDSVIDRGTSISRSVVFPHTYVGRNMDFSGKIVDGRHIISPDDGAFIDIEDAGVAMNLKSLGKVVPMPIPYEELKDRRYTALGDAETDRRVAHALSELSLDIAALRLPKVLSVFLGGGYGRGEGGTPLYNDLDFFVLTDRATDLEKEAIAMQLEVASLRYRDELGVDVDFCRPKNVRDFMKDTQRLMMQELIRGYVVIYGRVDALSFMREIKASELPASEALRLLVNRGMGLALARDSKDVDFVRRNANKAVLAAGDALLIARHEYAWSCKERAERLANEAYSRAVGYKFSPTTEAPSWETAYETWRDAVARVMGLCGGEIKKRRLRHAVRRLVRRRDIGRIALFGCDPLYDMLLRIEDILAMGRKGPTLPSDLMNDWRVFN